MKFIYILIVFILSSYCYSQENLFFKNVPTYFNCNPNKSADERLKEIKSKTIEHIISNIDSLAIKKLELKSEDTFKQIISYSIDSLGIIIPDNINITSGNEEFDSIVKKIVNTIPKFIPYDEYFSSKFNLNFVAKFSIKNNTVISYDFFEFFEDQELIPTCKGCKNSDDKLKCFQEKIGNHIFKTQKYPKDALRNGITGRISTLFIINKDGEITDIKAKGAEGTELLQREAIRIISLIPKMIEPGKINGKPIKVKYSQPITFKFK
jgi:TonB family protein